MKKTFLRNRIFYFMLIIIILQSSAFFIALFSSGALEKLNQESFRILEEQTNSKAADINRIFNALALNTIVNASNLNNNIINLADEKNMPIAELFTDYSCMEQVTSVSYATISHLFESNSVTGAFIILEGSSTARYDDNYRYCVYLTDSSPDNSTTESNNYVMEIGPPSLSQSMQIPLSRYWQMELHLDTTSGDRDFYTDTLALAKENPGKTLEQLGFWSNPFVMFDDNMEKITYTVPLITNQGEVYGAFGIELSSNYIAKSILNYYDLPYNNSFYLVANLHDEHILNTDWFISSGPMATRYIKLHNQYPLHEIKDQKSIKELSVSVQIGEDQTEKSIDFYTTTASLDLYGNDSIHSGNSWYLFGFTAKDEVLGIYKNTYTYIFFAMFLSSLLGILIAIFISYIATKDINLLSQYIHRLNPDKPVTFKQTNLYEIDTLTQAIESLSSNLKESSNRISKILDLTDMPLGCFEVDYSDNYVFVTPLLKNLLNIPDNENKISYLPIEEWNLIYNNIIQNREEGYENVYYMGDDKWIRMQSIETKGSHLGVVMDITQDVLKQRQLEYEIDHDVLTQLLNRNAFKRKAFEYIQDKPDKIGVLVFADIDNLKYVNDTFGHDTGDKYIIATAEMFNCFTEIGALVSRISGDEFAMFIHGFDTYKEARTIVFEAMDQHLNQIFENPDMGTQRIRTSIGIAWYPYDSIQISELIKFADYAMYEAKNNIKGAIFEFNKSSYSKHAYIREKQEAINTLIDDRLVQFAFQPIIDLNSGEIYGYEALMRSKMKEFTSPFEILSVASDQSKLYQIEKLTLFGVMDWMSQNFESVKEHNFKIFINSIANQMLSQDDWAEIKIKYGHLFPYITFEITENETDNEDFIVRKATFFHDDLGALVAIDDYGSGYSNEIRVLSLHPDIIKIDKTFIRDIHMDKDKQALFKNISSYCKTRNVKVLAEGVETLEELKEVLILGADFAQGFFFAKPDYSLQTILPEKINVLMTVKKQLLT